MSIHLRNLFDFSITTVLGYIMNIIFNLSSVGLRNDERFIIIPDFLDVPKIDFSIKEDFIIRNMDTKQENRKENRTGSEKEK